MNYQPNSFIQVSYRRFAPLKFIINPIGFAAQNPVNLPDLSRQYLSSCAKRCSSAIHFCSALFSSAVITYGLLDEQLTSKIRSKIMINLFIILLSQRNHKKARFFKGVLK